MMTERCHEHLQTRAFLDFHLPLFLCLPVSLSPCTLGKVGWTPEAWSQMHQKLSFVVFFPQTSFLLLYPYYSLLQGVGEQVGCP